MSAAAKEHRLSKRADGGTHSLHPVVGASGQKPPYRINGKRNPEYFKWWHETNREYVRAYRKARRESGIEPTYMAEYRRRNKVALQAWAKRWWEKNKKAAIEKNKQWKREHPERAKQIAKRMKTKMLATLPDHYIRHLIGLPREYIPPQLIDATRANIKLKRLCQGQRTSKNSATNS